MKKKKVSKKTTKSSSHTMSPSHIVGVGASAGGLEAIEAFFSNIPPDTGMAFVVIQHLSPDYKSLMVELLSKKTKMDVLRVEDGVKVEANKVYLIPPKKNMKIFNGTLLLSEQDAIRGLNLPIDMFLISLAEDQTRKAVAIILSGTGSDGMRGVRSVKEFGGMVMIQSEESAKFDGMPRAAASTGLVDYVLSPEEMPEQLMSYAKHPYEVNTGKKEDLLANQDGMTRIFAMLKEKSKVDFTYYKPSTISRRIERRITVAQMNDLEEYVQYLIDYPNEVMTLYKELLIGVTSFFRDKKVFEEIESKVLYDLIKNTNKRELRFWAVGCSTGEEAYTLAIIAREIMEKLEINLDVKIFATDLDKAAIVVASQGIYQESIAADLGPKLVSKYFYHKNENLHIVRNIREMVVFAQHNVLKDPPFTNIDFLSCRNLLIYLQPILQKKALEMFDFSLNPGGILLLGSSETIGDMVNQFDVVHSKYKIYRSRGEASKTDSSKTFDKQFQYRFRPQNQGRYEISQNKVFEDRFFDRLLDTLSGSILPLCVVVNENLDVVHTIGETSGYFKLPSGKANFNITKMVSRDLAIPISTGIQKVLRTREELIYNNIHLKHFDETKIVKMHILPMKEKKGQESLALVFLDELEKKASSNKAQETTTYDIGEEARQRIQDLEQELQFVRENLQATIEELETANEELQATNEELLASNEELQSTNEELQSTNEELYTVNAEYQDKIIELTELTNDVDNLLTSSKIGQLLLDENFEIRRFSPAITECFKVLDDDLGRPITHIAHLFKNFEPFEKMQEVIEKNEICEEEVSTVDEKKMLIRIIPYRIGPQSVSGIVFTSVNITKAKETESLLVDSQLATEMMINYMPAGLFIYQLNDKNELILEMGNEEAVKTTGIKISEFKGKNFSKIWPKADEKGLTESLMNVIKTGKPFKTEEYVYSDKNLKGVFRIHSFKLPEDRLAVTFEDITEKKKFEQDLIQNEELYHNLFKSMAQGVVYQDAEGKIIRANPAAEKILGLSVDQLQGKTSMDPSWKAIGEDGSSFPGEKHPAMISLKTGKPIYGTIMGVENQKFKKTKWIVVSAIPEFRKGSKKPFQVFATFEDITEKIKKDNALKVMQGKMDYAIDISGKAWWEWDIENDIVSVSSLKARLIGYNPEEIESGYKFWTSKIHPKDYDRVMNAMKTFLKGKNKDYTVKYRLKTKSGSYVTCREKGQVVEKDLAGKPVRLFGTVEKVEE